MKDPRDVIIEPVVSEKSYSLLEDNVYTFVVHKSATKPEIRDAVEMLLDVKVAKVNTKITITGKHASIRLAEGYDAEEAALKLGAF